MNDRTKYFLPYQLKWIDDKSPLKLMQKSRQVGISYADAYHSVTLACNKESRLDVFVTSRDRFQARLYIEDCKHWAEVLNEVIVDLGEILLAPDYDASAYVIEFANGRRIYSLSSNPNALAGKHGQIKMDEFALHLDQRLLYRIAKPAITWGGTLTIISTHRGVGSVFNQLVREVLEGGNPMGWSLHTVTLANAVSQGLVEKINQKTGKYESREAFLARTRAQCIDEEQWLQEYCCTPADEASAFFSYEMLNACEDGNVRLMSPERLEEYLVETYPGNHFQSLYVGVDVARKHNLCVIDVGETLGDVTWDRLRLELQDQPFSEIRAQLYRILRLPAVKRCCIDATGLGMQLAEEAQAEFGYKVEPITFTPQAKESLAFGLRRDLEERKLRLVRDDKLRADLRALKKEVTLGGKIRFIGETPESHCDRTWALALRQHASRHREEVWALVC